MSNTGEVRLQKLLSECGVASRRHAEELIAAGRVKVNGRSVGVGDKADLHRDIVTVDGRRIALPEQKRYLLLNKPRGYVTTLSDERGRKCVAELVKNAGGRVFPVGRLDRESEGALLLTNDGEFANAMTHPARHIAKTYRVTLRAMPTDEQLVLFREGMLLEGETRKTAPAEILLIQGASERPEADAPARVVAEVVLYEGRNRQIRRMFEQLGIPVARLRRIAVGTVKLGMLPTGQWRELELREVQSLLRQTKEDAEGKDSAPAKKRRGGSAAHGRARSGRSGDSPGGGRRK